MTRPDHIADDVWCLTCEHVHIPSIPAVTHVCADCGFGQWDLGIAEWHANAYPDHIVYPLHHRTVPLDQKPLEPWLFGPEAAARLIAAASWPFERRENRESWAPRMITDPAMAEHETRRALRRIRSAAASLGLEGIL